MPGHPHWLASPACLVVLHGCIPRERHPGCVLVCDRVVLHGVVCQRITGLGWRRRRAWCRLQRVAGASVRTSLQVLLLYRPLQCTAVHHQEGSCVCQQRHLCHPAYLAISRCCRGSSSDARRGKEQLPPTCSVCWCVSACLRDLLDGSGAHTCWMHAARGVMGVGQSALTAGKHGQGLVVVQLQAFS